MHALLVAHEHEPDFAGWVAQVLLETAAVNGTGVLLDGCDGREPSTCGRRSKGMTSTTSARRRDGLPATAPIEGQDLDDPREAA